MQKITPEVVENNIATEWYTTVPGGTMTICVLTTISGFQIIGESACVNPADFNAELGKQYAKEEAVDKLCGFMGYHLKEENICKQKL